MSGTALAARAIGALTGVAAARSLGPSGRGELALLAAGGLLGAAVGSGGLDLWAARSLAQGTVPASVAVLLRRHQLLVLVALSLVALTLVATTGWPTGPVLATAAVVWATVAATLRLGVLQGGDRMVAFGAAGLVGTAVYGVAVAVLVVLDRTTVTTFLLANALGSLATAAYPVRGARSAASRAALSAVVPPAIRLGAALRFGIPAMVGGLVTMALYRVDVLLVGWWRSPAEAGRYAVALAVAEVLWVLPNSAAQAIVPRAAGPVRRVDTARVAKGLLVAMSAAAVVTVAAGWLLIPVVFGDEFTAARTALPGLAAASVAAGLWKVLSFDLLAGGRPGTRIRTGAAGIAVMVAVDAVTVPRWGASGAAVGALVAYAVAAGLCLRTWRRCRRAAAMMEPELP
jgi:O-antigen/teichoic acid export membrane protein